VHLNDAEAKAAPDLMYQVRCSFDQQQVHEIVSGYRSNAHSLMQAKNGANAR
jgi:uncharacterized protein YcbK (DUF882 family)